MGNKAIYNPSGKAGEYSYWAVNFYNGCSADCDYCYTKKGVFSHLWSTTPTLKKCFKDSYDALKVFVIELEKNLEDLKEHGLFFNFISDPFLKETIELNFQCIWICHQYGVPVKVLTKQTWWVEKYPLPENVSVGYTLTGMDHLEPGADTNKDRIQALRYFSNKGFNTWASIEPVIDINSSIFMIFETCDFIDHFKIGLLSGEKFDSFFLVRMVEIVNDMLKRSTVYWKDGLLKQAGIIRDSLPDQCVDRSFKFWK